MRTALISLLALALAADRAYPCAEPMLTDRPLTADGAVIPSGGGVVMATVNGFDGDDGGDGARLQSGTTNVEAKRDYIAPALYVIVAKPQNNRAIELVGTRGKPILRLTQGDLVPKHAPPKLAKAHSTLAPAKPDPQPKRSMWEASSQYTIELGEAPPADVLALVVYDGDNGIAWARPAKGQTTYSFWGGGKRCSPGPSSLPQGRTITVAWLDAGGRVSLRSKPIQVGVTPPPKKP